LRTEDESDMPAVKFTIDKDEIRRWAEHRGGVPATIRGSVGEDGPGILRISLPAIAVRAHLQALTWDEFFAAVDANELAFMIDERGCRLIGRRGLVSARAANERNGRARPRSRVGAVTLLERQHRDIEAMLHRLHGCDDDVEAKRVQFGRVADALAAHAKIEDTIFYPAVLGGDTGVELHEAAQEHLAIKRALADLLECDPAAERFDLLLGALEELLERHVAEEEDDLFASIEVLDHDARLELGARMQRVYDQLLQTEPRFELADDISYAMPMTGSAVPST
jgi:hypothetical protein